MKKISSYIILVAMPFCVVACSQEELTSSYFSDAKAVHISAQIGTGDVTGSFLTRSTPWEESSNFNPGDEIAISSSSQFFAVYKLQNDGTTWLPVSNEYLAWEKGEKTVFTAYYPVKDGVSAENFQQPTDFSKDYNMSTADYMTFKGEFSNNDNNSISLKMERKMARLKIMLQYYAYVSSSVSIHSNVSGYANGGVKKGNTVITPYCRQIDGYFYALLVPTTKDDSKTFLSITAYDYNNTPHEFTVKGIPELKAGYSYEMTIELPE